MCIICLKNVFCFTDGIRLSYAGFALWASSRFCDTSSVLVEIWTGHDVRLRMHSYKRLDGLDPNPDYCRMRKKTLKISFEIVSDLLQAGQTDPSGWGCPSRFLIPNSTLANSRYVFLRNTIRESTQVLYSWSVWLLFISNHVHWQKCWRFSANPIQVIIRTNWKFTRQQEPTVNFFQIDHFYHMTTRHR